MIQRDTVAGGHRSVVSALVVLIASCASPQQATRPTAAELPSAAQLSRPARPNHCRSVPPAVSPAKGLQKLLAAAQPGSRFCLDPGVYEGPLVLGPGVTVWGPPDAIIRSGGEGTTVELSSPNAALLGVTVDGSGSRYDQMDAAVHVTADDTRVEGVTVRRAVFGLLVEQANRVLLRGNLVQGPDAGPLGLRGDGIRLWETRASRIEHNRMIGSRDMVVWYSPGNRLIGNTVLRSRYGTHFMYSHDNVVRGNRYIDNVVGVFVMYSSNLTLSDNVLARSGGAGGMGLGIKESGNLQVTDNRFLLNNVGAYLDTSPLQPDHHNEFARNQFRLCDTAVVFHSSQKRNVFRDNVFADNQLQVRVDGRGDALGVSWIGNDFDDYAGYDLDGDGVGDVPYKLRRLSSDLQGRFASLAFFRGSLTLSLLDVMSQLFPLFQPRTILIDRQPSVGGDKKRGAHAG